MKPAHRLLPLLGLVLLGGCAGLVNSPDPAIGKPIEVTAGPAGSVATRIPGCEGWPSPRPVQGDPWVANFGCANALNLTRMVSDPRELALPKAIAPADGDQSSRAVDALREGRSKPLPVDQIAPIQQRQATGG